MKLTLIDELKFDLHSTISDVQLKLKRNIFQSIYPR